jgi:hypothetical protein
MRYSAAEKLEIIRLVEQSSFSVRRTLAHSVSRVLLSSHCSGEKVVTVTLHDALQAV